MWYGALHRNTHDPSQPLATVLLHDVRDNKLIGQFRCTRVSALSLGLLPIGSVWHDGKIVAKAKLATKRFEVDFSANGWEHYCLKGDDNPLIPASVYPLFNPCRDEIADAWMLRFHLADGDTLVIPSLEFFTRCYGSSRLRRTLLTSLWDEIDGKLFKQLYEIPPPEENDEWRTYPATPYIDSDVPLISHIKHDQYAKLQVKQIMSQILSRDPNHRLFLKVAPWTNHKGKIEVSGFYIKITKTFVCMNIIGIGLSAHPKYVIYRTRSSIKNSEYETETNSIIKITAQTNYTNPELIDDESPSQDRGLTKLQEPPLLWIDEEPILTRHIDQDPANKKLQKNKRQNMTTITDVAPHSHKVSAGTAYGRNKDVLEGLTHSDQEVKFIDQIWNMWESLTNYAKDHPDIICGIYHYTIGIGFRDIGYPQLINFPLTYNDHDTEVDSNNKLINSKRYGVKRFPIVYGNPPKRRGFLLLKVVLKNNHFYIIEIQQRYNTTSEHFAGLAFQKEVEGDFEKFLFFLLEKIKLANGHVTELAKRWKGGKAFAYRHKTSQTANFTFENVVQTILLHLSK